MTAAYNLKGSNLFKPIKVGNHLALQNRVALPPMTRNRASNYVPYDSLNAEYYSQRAQRAGTLLITEGTIISPEDGGNYNPPGIFTDEQQHVWSQIIKAVHDKKSYIFVQIWSIGLLADPATLLSQGFKFRGPSDGTYFNKEQAEAAVKAGNPSHGLTKSEIKELIANFVSAAKRSIAAGADGVEIHSANGYLLNNFLSAFLNKRTDEYGGSVENRARLALELVDAIGKEIGYSKVSIRLSPYFEYENRERTFEPDSIAVYSYLASELEKRRLEGQEIAYLSIFESRVHTAEFPDDNEWFFQVYKGIIVRAGGYSYNWEKTKADVDANDRTIIAIGRHFIANPDLIDRIENDLPLSHYHRDTFYTSGAKGYTDYPEYSD